jgi:hypothetical protein
MIRTFTGSQATQLSQADILPYYRTELGILLNNPALNAEVRTGINNFIQQINDIENPAEVRALLPDFILEWGANPNIIANNIITQILNIWNTASGEDIDAIHTDYATILASFTQGGQPSYNSAIEGHQPSQYDSIDREEAMGDQPSLSPDVNNYNPYEGALQYMAEHQPQPAAYQPPPPVVQRTVQQQAAAHAEAIHAANDENEDAHLYDINSQGGNSQGAGQFHENSPPNHQPSYYGDSFPLHQASPPYAYGSYHSTQDSNAGTQTAGHQPNPYAGNNNATQQYHFTIEDRYDESLKDILATDPFYKKNEQKTIGSDAIELKAFDVFHEMILITI